MNFTQCFMLRISELNRGWSINIYDMFVKSVIDCQICKNRMSLSEQVKGLNLRNTPQGKNLVKWSCTAIKIISIIIKSAVKLH